MSVRFVSTSVRRPAPHARLRKRSGRLATGVLAAVLALTLLGQLRGDAPNRDPRPLDLTAAATNPTTPGSLTGYGFDQCLTPSQAAMTAWLEHSPFLAVGVYISGNSRACRNQPNLTPAWVSTQLTKGWRILPITLGPQSTCVGRFPRYGASIDPTISNNSTSGYAAARKQGGLEAINAVAAAQALGITPGSTLWYDIEGWSDYRNATCRESALAFLSGWTIRMGKNGYVSGVYSSAGSGMRILEDARAARRTDVTLPARIWLARYDNVANTSASQHFSDAGWQKARVKQYTGGHNETWGGVTINIDRNFLDLGNSTPAAESHCGGVRIDLYRYRAVTLPTTTSAPNPDLVKALQCLLREKGVYVSGPINGNYGPRTRAAAQAWQKRTASRVSTTFAVRDWMTLLSHGPRNVIKIGSRGADVRRAQRAIHAAMPTLGIKIDGIFGSDMAADVRSYRSKVGLTSAGIVNTSTWAKLQAGRY